MRRKDIVLASAGMALVMVLSMMALPALALSGPSALVAAADSIDEGEDPAALMSEVDVYDPLTFVKATVGEPDLLDPAIDYESAGAEVIQNVYETLVWYDGSSASCMIPVLATEVPTVANGGISADGMNYTFNIRGGVTFHDGTDLTAEDVAYSVQRVLRIHDLSSPAWILEQAMTAYVAWYLGATVNDWALSMDVPQWLLDGAGLTDLGHVLEEADVQAVAEFMVTEEDTMTVNFRLTKPYPAFLRICAATVMSVVSKDYVEANGGVVNGEFNDHMWSNMCGTGPYELASWDIGVEIHLTRFADYWGPAPSIDDVHIVQVNDMAERLSMLENGTADTISWFVSNEDQVDDVNYTVVKGSPSFDLAFMPFNFNIDADTANTQYGGDITTDFFWDVHMRKAFAYLIDYAQYIEDVERGNAIQPNGVIPQGMFGYDADVPVYEYDLAAAEAELMQTSWWSSGFTVPLFYNAGNIGRQTLCELMKAGLEAIDPRFTATTNALDWIVFLMEVYDSNGFMPVYSVSWGPDYADPDDYATPMLDSFNGVYPYYTGYANASIDDLVRDAAAEVDEDLRAQLYSDLGYAVRDDCPYIWVSQGCNFHVERSWVEGYYYNPMFGDLYYPALSKLTDLPVIVAAIDVDPETGTVGFPMTFDGSDSYSLAGPIVSYEWDIDYDSDHATGVVLEYTFMTAGNHSVNLTVTDSLDNTDTAYLTVLVEEVSENEPPMAVATADPNPSTVGWDVVFNGSFSSDPDGYIESYSWIISSDGTELASLTGVLANYTFWETGTYNITLTVTDDGGLWDTDVVMMTVADAPPVSEPPVADAGADQVDVKVGDTVTFDGSGSSDDVLVTNYTWTFTYDGDTVALWGIGPTFVFDIAGTYLVTLNVSDGEGLRDHDSLVIVVTENVAPVADAGADQTVDEGDTVTFDGTGSTDSDGTIESYWWVFTYNGTTQNLSGAEPTFEFEIAGTYTVTLTVTDSDGDTGTDTVTITVEEAEEEPPPVEESFLEKYGLAIAIIVIVIVLIVVAMLLMKKKKSS